MNKRLQMKVFLIVLLMTLLFPSVNIRAAGLRAVKDLQPGYTTVAYYNKKNNKYCYSTIDLVIRKKSAHSVLASQLPNQYRPGSKALFKIGGKNIVTTNSGKKIRLSGLKKGTKIRVTYKNGLLETHPIRFSDILRIDMR